MADTVTCPKCQSALAPAGRTERCEKCDGAWIHEDVLVGMLQETTSALVALPWVPREGDARAAPDAGPRPCAVCKQPMQAVSLSTVALDRCAEHGVWFDAKELADVLKHAKEFKAEPSHEPGDHRHGLLGALARLFGG